MLARPVDQPERAVEPVPPGLLVPAVTHLVAVWRVPAARAEHRRGIDPHAAGAERVEPILARGRQVAHRGDPLCISSHSATSVAARLPSASASNSGRYSKNELI